MTEHSRIMLALRIASDYGVLEGDRPRAWVIDQMVRALTGEDYVVWVASATDGPNGPDTYTWDTGIRERSCSEEVVGG